MTSFTKEPLKIFFFIWKIMKNKIKVQNMSENLSPKKTREKPQN
jgi:hypothetical protein